MKETVLSYLKRCEKEKQQQAFLILDEIKCEPKKPLQSVIKSKTQLHFPRKI